VIKIRNERVGRALVNDGWASLIVPLGGCVVVLAFIAALGGRA